MSSKETAPRSTTRWTVDRSHSVAEFSIPTWWGLRTVRGRFRDFDGFYERGETGAAMELVIDAASLETGDAARDGRLRSERFLDVEHHPQVTFSSTLVEETEGRVAAVGHLHARGVAIPATFESALRGDGEQLELEAAATIDPRELGIDAGPLGMIRPAATLRVVARLRRVRP